MTALRALMSLNILPARTLKSRLGPPFCTAAYSTWLFLFRVSAVCGVTVKSMLAWPAIMVLARWLSSMMGFMISWST